jgi:hypothetical protein
MRADPPGSRRSDGPPTLGRTEGRGKTSRLRTLVLGGFVIAAVVCVAGGLLGDSGDSPSSSAHTPVTTTTPACLDQAAAERVQQSALEDLRYALKLFNQYNLDAAVESIDSAIPKLRQLRDMANRVERDSGGALDSDLTGLGLVKDSVTANSGLNVAGDLLGNVVDGVETFVASLPEEHVRFC